MNKDIFGKEKPVPNHFIHTPKEVIGLISHLLKIPEGTILDPSCGDGSILYELARTLTENQKLNIKLLGYENSSANCETARFKLSSHNIDAEIINTDFLASDSSTKFNMILTNPPFNYHRSGGRTESLFIGRIMDSLNDYGVASIIMPYGFLDRQIDSKYRKRLYQEFDIQLITLLPIGIFPEKVHTCIICFRKCPPTNEYLNILDLRASKRSIQLDDIFHNFTDISDKTTIKVNKKLITEPYYYFSLEKLGLLSEINFKHSSASTLKPFSLFNRRPPHGDYCNATNLFEQTFKKNEFPLIKGKQLFTLRTGRPLPSPMETGVYPVIDANKKIHRLTYKFNTAELLPTIIINRVGDNCGRVYIINSPSFITGNSMYITQLHKRMDIYYLCYLFDYMNLNQYKSGSGIKHITQNDLYDRFYIVPPYELQKAFSNKLRDIISFDIGGKT